MNANVSSLDLEHKIVQHCAPTLAGIKPANLFTYRDSFAAHVRNDAGYRGFSDAHECKRSFATELRACRAKLAPCGVHLYVLTRRCTGLLLYVYRPDLLACAMQDARACALLASEGYDTSDLDACISRLRARICGTDEESRAQGTCAFPHEIGLFLGYPVDDVIGFIENKGKNYLCNGCWKVYSNERDARECFCCYKQCTAHYEHLFNEGAPIERLASVSPAEQDVLRPSLLRLAG